MTNFSAKDIQALRRSAGVGMLDAKRALEESDGDFESASQWLRVNGLAGAAKREDREASQGAVALASSEGAVAIVELRCETDFVAKAEEFVALVNDLATLVASKGEGSISELQDEVDRLRTVLKENISIGRVIRLESQSGEEIGSYLHQQAGRGVNAVAIVVASGSESLAHDLAVHAAFTKPLYLRREDVPEEEVLAERRLVEELSRNEGKPEASLAKVVEGRMNGWFKERCLVEQSYVKDEKKTVAELLGTASIVGYAQVIVGS